MTACARAGCAAWRFKNKPQIIARLASCVADFRRRKRIRAPLTDIGPMMW